MKSELPQDTTPTDNQPSESDTDPDPCSPLYVPDNWEKTCDGHGCSCSAWSENECACDADWTTADVYKLRAEVNLLKDTLKDVMEKELIHGSPEAPTIVEVIQELKLHNDWRRGEAGEMTDPTRIGIIIDTAIKLLTQYKGNE